MGHTQWMPEVWLHVGIDYDSDGKSRRSEPPDDALGSTARYFVERGNYRRGEHWGYEVRMPRAMAATASRSYAAWQTLGVMRADGGAFPQPDAKARSGAGAGRPRLSDRPEFLCRRELQSLDELCAGAGPSRRPLRRRRTFRAEIPRQRTRPRRWPKSRKSSAGSPRSATIPAAPTAGSATTPCWRCATSAQGRH